MTALFLNSLEVHNFRAFRQLQIEQLGRVNLIVGKNNVGKSSLLEALWLYARQGSPSLIWELLEARDEFRPISRFDTEGIDKQVLAIRYLFHGRKEFNGEIKPIKIGPVSSKDDTLSISLDWYVEKSDEENRRRLEPLPDDEYELAVDPIVGLAIKKGAQSTIIYRLDRNLRGYIGRPTDPKAINHIFVPANGLTHRTIGELWDTISLTALEKDVLDALAIIAQEVEGLNLVGDPASGRDASTGRTRIPIVKLKGINQPIPLRNLGEGMNRLFSLTLALVNTKDGLLLIDEIESGLHYSVYPKLWNLVLKIAHQLNIQIFATTHSWDCIQGFQEVITENKQEEGVLIRLENRAGEIVPILFDENLLSVATRNELEVR